MGNTSKSASKIKAINLYTQDSQQPPAELIIFQTALTGRVGACLGHQGLPHPSCLAFSGW